MTTAQPLLKTLQSKLSRVIMSAKPQSKPESNEFTSTTRFGEITLSSDKLITFSQGLFGFAECTSFGLSQVPGSQNSPLLLLHCPDRPEVTFVVVDPSALGLTFNEGDIEGAIKEAGYSSADTQVLVILTIYKTDETASITANLRAPILIDTAAQRGLQFIMLEGNYNTQHKI
jgi:flagellar assembly factor FliW